MEEEKKKLSPKTKKIINIVVDVFVALVLAFALLLAVCAISSKAKGYNQYTEVFGSAYIAVKTDSMAPTFDVDDLIKIKTVKGDQARKLKIGDVITFEYKDIDGDGKMDLVTHRITAYHNGVEGDCGLYIVEGDNPKYAGQTQQVSANKIVGVYQGKASGIGRVLLFMGTSTGFFVCVVLPTLLIVAYCAVNLFLVIRKEKIAQKAIEDKVQQEALVEERERIRQELLAEMQANAVGATENSEPVTEQQVADTEEQKAEEKPSEEDNKTDEEEK